VHPEENRRALVVLYTNELAVDKLRGCPAFWPIRPDEAHRGMFVYSRLGGY
jgi:hypothetical protein